MFYKNMMALQLYCSNHWKMSIHFCFNSSVSTHWIYQLHSFWYSGLAITPCNHYNETAILVAIDTKKHWLFHQHNLGELHRLLFMVSLYAAGHSGWDVRGLKQGHMQPSIKQYRCLHNHLYKQLVCTDECHSVEHFLQSKAESFHTRLVHTDTLLILHHLHMCNSEASGCRCMKLHTKCRKA